MRIKLSLLGIMSIMMLNAYSLKRSPTQNADQFDHVLEQFADLRILRYQVPGFDELSLDEKKLIYFLGQAALSGRDILWDQNGRYNLAIRQVLENIYTTYSGDKDSEEYGEFLVYLKRVWFSNGIYHHYSTDKILPGFSEEYFYRLVKESKPEGFPVLKHKDREESVAFLVKVMFDPDLLNKKVNQTPGVDMVAGSAVNFYQAVTEEEVVNYYAGIRDEDDDTPVSYGLNTRVIKTEEGIREQVWKSEGLYGEAIDKILYWLEKALIVAQSDEQEEGIRKLIAYYMTGDLEIWDQYNVIWVNDRSRIDFVNGFVEVYSDPLGMKGTWESVVNFKDLEATKRTETIAANAQWFEDHSPVDDRFKKKEVKGVTAKVITVAMLGGDCYPHSAG